MKFKEFSSTQTTKLILLGHTGAGKTGSTVSLAAAGYNVRILDLDKGVEVLKDFVLNKESPYRKPRTGLWDQGLADSLEDRISFVPISESTSISSKGDVLPKGDAWSKAMGQLQDWKEGETSYGNISTWTPKDVLVIDGLSRLADAAFTQSLAMNGRIGKPQQSDYGSAQGALKRLLQMLYSDEIKCNIVMICHIKLVELEGEPTRGFPQTIGSALSPEIGQFFNHALLARQSGQGDNVKRVITTKTSGLIQLKTPAPLRVKGEYDLATGLAEYFADIRKNS